MRKKKPIKAKEPIRIRFKSIANGNKSIYLDCYHNGKRSYEFLKLYIIPETTEAAKVQNANTMQAANAIKAQRMIELANNQAGIKSNSRLSKMLLVDWMRVYQKSLIRDGKTCGTIINSTVKMINEYQKGMLLKDVDKSFCIGIIDYMRNKYRMSNGKPLSAATIANYTRALSCALNKAVRDGVINQNPLHALSSSEKPQIPQSKREFLSIEEVKALISTDCDLPIVKQAFLFSCFCGLRVSDVKALTWGMISKDNGNYVCNIIMKKTKEQLYLPLSKEALKWLPNRGEAKDQDNVFPLPSNSCVYSHLQQWAKAAGITKHVSFHVSRHTFATMMISLGSDLYTVSKLLGHANIKVTEVYAKLVNAKKFDAVNLVNDVFLN